MSSQLWLCVSQSFLDKNNRKHQKHSSNFNDHDGSFDLMFSVDLYW